MTSNTNSKSQQSPIEEVMKNRQYEFFNDWVSNFALNLPNIWSGKSARDLDPSKNKNYEKGKNSAIPTRTLAIFIDSGIKTLFLSINLLIK